MTTGNEQRDDTASRRDNDPSTWQIGSGDETTAPKKQRALRRMADRFFVDDFDPALAEREASAQMDSDPELFAKRARRVRTEALVGIFFWPAMLVALAIWARSDWLDPRPYLAGLAAPFMFIRSVKRLFGRDDDKIRAWVIENEIERRGGRAELRRTAPLTKIAAIVMIVLLLAITGDVVAIETFSDRWWLAGFAFAGAVFVASMYWINHRRGWGNEP